MIRQPAHIGVNVSIGENVVIDPNVWIGDNVTIWHNCVIRNNVRLHDGVTIGHLVLIESDTMIGSNSTIQSQCHITKGAIIGNNVFFGPCVCCINERIIAAHGRTEQKLEGPIICDGARIGAATRIVPGIKIGANASIAMGSIVTKNIPKGQYWRGSPARYVSDVPEEEWI